MKTLNTLFLSALILAAAVFPVSAQNRTRFGSRYVAYDYAYGIQPNVAALQVNQGNSATGAASITVITAFTTLSDGTRLFPLSTVTPILVGVGSTQDSVTPSSVSNCAFDAGYGTCTVTATFTYTHGNGDPITTASYGLQEAIAAAVGNGGGVAVVDRNWANAGGTTAKITGATAYSNVAIEDTRSGDAYYSMQPTTLTSLAVPATLTGTTAVFSGTGTWTAAAQFTCVTYVDALGGEGPCSATFNQTPSASTSLTITSPAASTGAVGWRAYAGATYNAAYLLPVTSTACTLTTLESVMPACAIGSAGTWAAIFLTTTTLRPNGQSPTVNLNLPMPQGHTTFGYQPIATFPQPFQQHYGPFPAFGSLTAGQIAPLGSFNLPAGFLNTIGRTIRIYGKIALTTLNTATLPTITINAGWVGGTTAGAPVAVCSLAPAAAGASATANETFSCTLTTNAVGATAIGSVMTDGYEMLVAAAGGALTGATIDTGTAAIGSLGLFAQDTFSVLFTSTTNVVAGEQLLDLHVEVLQ